MQGTDKLCCLSYLFPLNVIHKHSFANPIHEGHSLNAIPLSCGVLKTLDKHTHQSNTILGMISRDITPCNATYVTLIVVH